MELNINNIFRSEYQSVLSFVRTKVKNVCDAEDITAEVFNKIAINLSSYDSNKSALKTWIRTITNRCIIDHYRANKYYCLNTSVTNINEIISFEGNEVFQFFGGSNVNADYDINNRELKKRINKAIEILDSNLKRIAYLYFLKEMEYTEIAEICQIPLGSVKGMIYRVRELLQSELKDLHTGRKSNVLEVIK
jgi:RNA polymerase sigma-70 factor (ECF subfamily)